MCNMQWAVGENEITNLEYIFVIEYKASSFRTRCGLKPLFLDIFPAVIDSCGFSTTKHRHKFL
jgi:hypothetical protein